MFHILHRSLGYLALAFSALAVLPLSGVVEAKGPGRSGFTPYLPNGQLRPNMPGNGNGLKLASCCRDGAST